MDARRFPPKTPRNAALWRLSRSTQLPWGLRGWIPELLPFPSVEALSYPAVVRYRRRNIRAYRSFKREGPVSPRIPKQNQIFWSLDSFYAGQLLPTSASLTIVALFILSASKSSIPRPHSPAATLSPPLHSHYSFVSRGRVAWRMSLTADGLLDQGQADGGLVRCAVAVCWKGVPWCGRDPVGRSWSCPSAIRWGLSGSWVVYGWYPRQT